MKGATATIKELASCRAWQDAFRYFHRICSTKTPDVVAYTEVIRACAVRHKWLHALAFLSHMQKSSVRADVTICSASITTFSKSGSWAHGLAAFSQFSNLHVEPNSIVYNATLTACEKGHQWVLAIQLLGKMRRNSSCPDVISYNAAMSSCEKSRQWIIAMRLLAEMIAYSLRPSVVTYSVVIAACERGSEWSLALHLLSRMQVAQLQPNAVTWSSLINPRRSLGAVSAVNLFAQAQTDLITCNNLLAGCATDQCWTQALALMLTMRRVSISPNEVTYYNVAAALERAQQKRFSMDLRCHVWKSISNGRLVLEDIPGFRHIPITEYIMDDLFGAAGRNFIDILMNAAA